MPLFSKPAPDPTVDSLGGRYSCIAGLVRAQAVAAGMAADEEFRPCQHKLSS